MPDNKQGSQMRFTPTELELLQNTFKGSEELIRLMRKVFLPELDAYAPIGQNIDLWMTIPVDQMTPEQALINLKARNTLITHLDQRLMELKALSESPDVERIVERAKKNSTK